MPSESYIKHINKTIVDYTSPARCTPITTIPADTFCSERVTVHCQWGGNPQNFPFPLGFPHSVRGGPSHGHRQHAQKNGKDRACGSGDILADRQTDRLSHRYNHHNTSPPLPRRSKYKNVMRKYRNIWDHSLRIYSESLQIRKF